MQTHNKLAYVSIVSTPNYLPGIFATALSLKQTGTAIPFFVCIPTRLAELCKHKLDIVKYFGGVFFINYDKSVTISSELANNNSANGDNRWNYTFDKLKVFELTQFDKIVYIDSDMFVLQNIDNLFDMPHMSATVAGKSYPGNTDWIDLNSGIMTIIPQKGILQEFMKIIPAVMKDKPSCGDQDILQKYYSDWTGNRDCDMGEKYNIMAPYASYYETSLGYRYTNDINDAKSIAVIHFIGEHKPWMNHWSIFSIIKQNITLLCCRILRIQNTKVILYKYNKLCRKVNRLLKA